MKSFPKQIHVTVEHEDTDMEYLAVSNSATAEGAITSTEKVRVATYELKEVKEGKLEPVFSALVG